VNCAPKRKKSATKQNFSISVILSTKIMSSSKLSFSNTKGGKSQNETESRKTLPDDFLWSEDCKAWKSIPKLKYNENKLKLGKCISKSDCET
jgi:hypothetical protein